jgi:hypothetical protein
VERTTWQEAAEEGEEEEEETRMEEAERGYCGWLAESEMLDEGREVLLEDGVD